VKKLKARSIFISDVHLGTRSCKAKELLDFLNNIQCERLFLVGDIIDFWNLKSFPYWNRDQYEVVKALLYKANSGTDILYIPGNHDECLKFTRFPIIDGVYKYHEYTHVTSTLKRYKVIHGDQFDTNMVSNKTLYKLGSILYDWLVIGNRIFNDIRGFFGLPYWSISMYLKMKAKDAVGVIDKFEKAAEEYIAKGYDGVICGHIHKPEARDGYYNCGDWVENMSFLYEDEDGNIKLGYYKEFQE
jgi:UDP-2,3-diacylglucosamine pyrophosphatase LpxH